MTTKGKRKPPEVVFQEGKPRAVILDIEEYQEMLEQMKKEPLSFRTLDDFLGERSYDRVDY